MPAIIALVDDDRNILISVSIALEAEGFTVDTYTSGEKAVTALAEKPADLVILDIKMPGMDGLETLTKLREKSDVPAIFLTSKDDEIDEMLGLKMGADDYIKKPFSQRLLIERVRSVLRRVESSPERDFPDQEDSNSLVVRGLLRLDPARHACTWKNEHLKLTVTEFLILHALAQRPGHVKSRDQLMDVAYGDQVFVDDRTVDSHIKRLRRKFREIDASFDHIETLYGLGYRFRER